MKNIELPIELIELARQSKGEVNIKHTLDMAWFLIALTMVERPRLIVEIGSYLGFGACSFGLGVMNTSVPGRIYTIDIAKDKTKRTKDNVTKLGLDKYITALTGDGREIIKTLLSKIDILFIDGNHETGAVYNDLISTFDYVNKGGIVLLHDYGAAPTREGIDTAIFKLEEGGHKMQKISLPIITGVLMLRKI